MAMASVCSGQVTGDRSAPATSVSFPVTVSIGLCLDPGQQLLNEFLHRHHLLPRGQSPSPRGSSRAVPCPRRGDTQPPQSEPGNKPTDLRAGTVHHAGVGFELDLGGSDDRFQLLCSEGPEADGDHGIHLPVALQDGDVLVHAVIRRLRQGRKCSGVPRRGEVLYLRPHTHHWAGPHLERDMAELLNP